MLAISVHYLPSTHQVQRARNLPDELIIGPFCRTCVLSCCGWLKNLLQNTLDRCGAWIWLLAEQNTPCFHFQRLAYHYENVPAVELLQAQRLEMAYWQSEDPLPTVLRRKRERASLHVRLLAEYAAALGRPPPPGAATHVRAHALLWPPCMRA